MMEWNKNNANIKNDISEACQLLKKQKPRFMGTINDPYDIVLGKKMMKILKVKAGDVIQDPTTGNYMKVHKMIGLSDLRE